LWIAGLNQSQRDHKKKATPKELLFLFPIGSEQKRRNGGSWVRLDGASFIFINQQIETWKINRTKFLNVLREGLAKKMDEQDEK